MRFKTSVGAIKSRANAGRTYLSPAARINDITTIIIIAAIPFIAEESFCLLIACIPAYNPDGKPKRPSTPSNRYVFGSGP